MEVLREDYENRIDLLSVEHENRLRDIERKYGEEIETLKYDLAEAMKLVQSGPVQEVVSEKLIVYVVIDVVLKTGIFKNRCCTVCFTFFLFNNGTFCILRLFWFLRKHFCS